METDATDTVLKNKYITKMWVNSLLERVFEMYVDNYIHINKGKKWVLLEKLNDYINVWLLFQSENLRLVKTSSSCNKCP